MKPEPPSDPSPDKPEKKLYVLTPGQLEMLESEKPSRQAVAEYLEIARRVGEANARRKPWDK